MRAYSAQWILWPRRPSKSTKSTIRCSLRVALVAGRDNKDIAELVVAAAKMVGKEKLLDPRFKLSETIWWPKEGAENEVFAGIIIDKKRLNEEMPESLEEPKVLVVDDALEPEEVEEEALSTEAGFQRYLELQEEFKTNLDKVVKLGVRFVVVDKGISDIAEEILTDSGVMVVTRVSSSELREGLRAHGARAVKRTGLKKAPRNSPSTWAGQRRSTRTRSREHPDTGRQEAYGHYPRRALTRRSKGAKGERICTDAASSVQAAVKGGVVPGGGAIELACPGS